MEKSKSYAPYIFAIFFIVFPMTTHNLWFKSGFLPTFILMFFVNLGLWRLVEWLLTRSEHLLVRCGYVLLGSISYIISFLGLDYYVLNIVMPFTGFRPLDFGFRLFFVTLIATVFIEWAKWSKARETAQIENLRLQAENIATKFQLLREQVNPEFLFHCLSTLRKMVRSDDPQTENYILTLADVYRQILKKQKNVVNLREELAFLQSYMFLMRYGRERAIFFDADVFDESLDYQLPIFSLQLLVDNCIKHNDFSENNPLYIHVFQEDAHRITIANNFQQKTAPLPPSTRGSESAISINMTQLETRYAFEGIEEGVRIEKNESTYSTTIKLF